MKPYGRLLAPLSLGGDRILFTRPGADGGPSSLWSIGVDGSDLRRLVDGIDWADLQPQFPTP
jgi:hypothetical protein